MPRGGGDPDLWGSGSPPSERPAERIVVNMEATPVTGIPPDETPDETPSPLNEDTHLGWDSLEICDGCGEGISAIWLVFTRGGELTLCGEHHRRFCKAWKAAQQ